ncbi:hypothetical protein ASPACDRAFT_111654 [Aspergillus aculeatus ATCC 16872]|uniref:RRM domain-containing protein n=1 Tax=Aspergillus aculeatus (strain ATCC 16872 / CBS 172.66 / WB 5094) TaxID=690307 RepID=A0A1L9X5J4_ASPA1|nr:uncharacterized protein ASPACDRAFT_111654 [Aspergillus aculeatus ATCC 16872]OJK03712.1 hypothetical protein ASPACDRAFT_111654 [Aspergillus aculeatus ATCC 16872]
MDSVFPAGRLDAIQALRNLPPNSNSVTISEIEYKRLLQASQQFSKLKNSLLEGGLSQETLDILIYGPPSTPPGTGGHTAGTASPQRGHTKRETVPRRRSSDESSDLDAASEDDHDDATSVDSPTSDGKAEDHDDSSRSEASAATPTDQRTVMIRNLPDRVTYRDVVDAVKSGALVHVYLRARERIASVSFVEEAAARSFLQHSNTHGLLVAGKRVETLWNDRQFYVPPYVRNKICNGASRNLVLYNVHPNVTEWVIRKDLEHIHNLIVISVKFNNGNAYISTNSVHNALFARSCMMSRFTYKGTRIGFYPDECAQSQGKVPIGPRHGVQDASAGKSTSVLNRFHILSLDGADDDESEDYDGYGGMSGRLNGNVRWTDNSVSA